MADRYATEAARIATLSLIDAAGFDVVQQSCVDMLADLLLRYLHEAGAGSHHYAELAGRSETNPIDVALALTDMGTSVAQLRDFMKHSEEVPFEQSISAFPLRKQSRPAPTFMDRGEAPPPHIPPWLPALPDKHTYVATPVYAGHEQDPQKQQMLLTEQRQQAEEAAVRLQARLSADSNQLLAAKLQRTEEAVAEEAAAAAAAAQEAGVQQQQQKAQQQEQDQDQEASEQPNAASSNPFIAGQWGDLTSELLWYQRREQQREQQRERGEAAGNLPVIERAIEHGPAGPAGVWEEAAGLEPGAGGDGAASGFVAQQLFASTDWKAQQQRTARVATGGRAVKDAFADAYDEVAAARLGKRHKRAQGAVPAAVHDPTRARVEGILAASAPQPVAPVVGQDTVMTEEI